jgi:hypothetical protein
LERVLERGRHECPLFLGRANGPRAQPTSGAPVAADHPPVATALPCALASVHVPVTMALVESGIAVHVPMNVRPLLAPALHVPNQLCAVTAES